MLWRAPNKISEAKPLMFLNKATKFSTIKLLVMELDYPMLDCFERKGTPYLPLKAQIEFLTISTFLRCRSSIP